jgi:hypothetical protein
VRDDLRIPLLSISVIAFEDISSIKSIDSSETADVYRIKLQRADGELCDAEVGKKANQDIPDNCGNEASY